MESFHPTEQDVRHHNNVIASEEYQILESALWRLGQRVIDENWPNDQGHAVFDECLLLAKARSGSIRETGHPRDRSTEVAQLTVQRDMLREIVQGFVDYFAEQLTPTVYLGAPEPVQSSALKLLRDADYALAKTKC